MLIGHVTATPELRYTPQGIPVCTFRVATNRVWTDQTTGQRQESAEFTACVAWRKLAEICSQVLTKGRQVYVDGRLQTREWETQERGKQRTTELVLENMIALGPAAGVNQPMPAPGRKPPPPPADDNDDSQVSDDDLAELASDDQPEGKPETKKSKPGKDQNVPPEDIPF